MTLTTSFGVIPKDCTSKMELILSPSWERLDPNELRAPPCIIFEKEWMLASWR